MRAQGSPGVLEQPPSGGCRKRVCKSSEAAKLCSGGCSGSETSPGASRAEPREPYIMFADPKPYLVRRKKKAPWEKVEERLKRG